MDVSPLLVAVFAFTFAITMGVLWEIFEFAIDWVFGTTMQSWDLPHDTTLIGRAFQGSGLRDTMSDLYRRQYRRFINIGHLLLSL